MSNYSIENPYYLHRTCIWKINRNYPVTREVTDQWAQLVISVVPHSQTLLRPDIVPSPLSLWTNSILGGEVDTKWSTHTRNECGWQTWLFQIEVGCRVFPVWITLSSIGIVGKQLQWKHSDKLHKELPAYYE